MDLSAFFQTKAQANDFSSRIATLSEQVYETNFNLETALLEQFGIKKKEAFMTLLRETKTNTDNMSGLKRLFADIQQTITTLPILTLTVGFEPKEQTLKTLSEWFLLNIKRQMLFDMHVDPHIIAGAVISFNGKSIDYSLREKVESVIQNTLSNEQKK